MELHLVDAGGDELAVCSVDAAADRHFWSIVPRRTDSAGARVAARVAARVVARVAARVTAGVGGVEDVKNALCQTELEGCPVKESRARTGDPVISTSLSDSSQPKA